MLVIRAPARIHIGLLALSTNSWRRNGGVGFAVDGLSTSVRVERNDEFVLMDERDVPVTSDEIKAALERIARAAARMGATSSAKLTVERASVGAHTGFGSGTATLLAAIEGVALLNNIVLTSKELVTLSGRGGTSGIGINTYFNGGYVFDLGHRRGDAKFGSSDEVFATEFPLIGWLCSFPEWEIGVCLPQVASPSIAQEASLFDSVCPLPLADSALSTYHALMGVHASMMEGDRTEFAHAVQSMQATAWKNAEWGIHGPALREAAALLRESGAIAVGMSSVGPGLYFFAEDVSATIGLAESKMPVPTTLRLVRPNNQGRVVTYD